MQRFLTQRQANGLKNAHTLTLIQDGLELEQLVGERILHMRIFDVNSKKVLYSGKVSYKPRFLPYKDFQTISQSIDYTVHGIEKTIYFQADRLENGRNFVIHDSNAVYLQLYQP